MIVSLTTTPQLSSLSLSLEGEWVGIKKNEGTGKQQRKAKSNEEITK
jgi:hypothetical protein